MTWLLLLIISQAPKCDSSLWNHVYNRGRLTVLHPCMRVSGVVEDASGGSEKDGVGHSSDGDTHGWLKPDAKFVVLMNQANRREQRAHLVFEIVCRYPVTKLQAVRACWRYTSPIQLLPVGTHACVTGAIVRDEHHGWIEIHPVTSIEPCGA